MTADIEEDNLLVGDHHGQGDPVTVGDAHRLDSLQFTGQMVISQVGLERVDLQVAQGSSEFGTQFRVLVNELFRGAGKTCCPDKIVHA